MKLSIRTKLIAFTICIILLVGGSISLYSIYQGRERALHTFKNDALQTTTLLSGTVINDLYFLDISALRHRLQNARVNPNIVYTHVFDAEGTVLTDGTGQNPLGGQKLPDSFTGEMLQSKSWISRTDDEILKVGGPLLTSDGVSIGYLQVGYSLDHANEIVRGTTQVSFYITLLCLVIGAGLAVIMATGFSRPIESIVAAALAIGRGDLDTRLTMKRGDEFATLAESINGMAEALQLRGAETEEKTRQLQALDAIATATSRSLKIDEVLHIALHKTLEVTGRGVGFVRLKDEVSSQLRLVAHRGLSESYVAFLEKGERVGWMAAEVMATGEVLSLDDPSPGDLLEESWREGIRATAWVPIQTHGQVIGVLTVASKTPQPFEVREVDLLKAIGNIVGPAVVNARLYEETRQRAEKLEALNELAHLITSSLSTQKVFDFVVRSAAKFLNAKMVRLWAEDQTSGSFVVRASCGIEQPLLQQHTLVPTLRAGEGVIGRIIENKTAEYLLDVREEPRWLNKQMARSLGLISFAGVPIVMGDRVLGVLTIMTDHLHEFSEEEKGLMKGFADQAAVAIENARLYEETRRNLERVQALREIDRAITSTLDLRTVLDVLLEKIDLVLPYSATTVRLLNKESGAIEPVACRNLDEKEWKAERWRGGRGIPNVVFETKAPVTISNVQSDPQNRDQEFFRKHGLVSYLGVPLIVQDDVLGVISFYTKEEHDFNNEEVEFLATLAGQAAIAIQNSQLYEEMIKLAADLSRSNKVKDEFLSVMSHELRTPLNVVMGYTAMVRDGLLGEINPEQEKALEKVISRAGDQLTMISSILQAVHMEAEVIKVKRQEVGLKNFLDDLKSSYSIPLGKEISLVWDYPSGLPVIHTDDERLKHVLQNLINNAIKFTEQGNVTISARIIEGSWQKAVGGKQHERRGDADGQLPTANCLLDGSALGRGYVELKVSDTGVGIAEEHFSLIFERFHQVDSSETRSYGGIGIGLYIVKKFTELLGGKVEVESKPGKGSTFTVTIPVAIHQ